MSDLRTRIAAVLPSIFDRIADGECVEWTDIADMLIRELGLTEDEEMDIGATGQPRFYRRYVTEWTSNG